MTLCGKPARFPRTGSECWEETSPKRSFKEFPEKHGPGSFSDEHFTVDGTLLEAWASHKSFRPVDPVAKKKNDQEPKPPAARWDEMKPVGMLRQPEHRGLERVGWMFTLTAAYNLVLMRTPMSKYGLKGGQQPGTHAFRGN
jgi:hypothetical protein